MGRKVSEWQREKNDTYGKLSFEVVKLIYLFSFYRQDINKSIRERYKNKNNTEKRQAVLLNAFSKNGKKKKREITQV
jgi:hypothetical protein